MDTKTKPAIGSTFQTGEISPVSGEFACMKCEEAGGENVIMVGEDDTFPKCEECNAAVTWRLERYTE